MLFTKCWNSQHFKSLHLATNCRIYAALPDETPTTNMATQASETAKMSELYQIHIWATFIIRTRYLDKCEEQHPGDSDIEDKEKIKRDLNKFSTELQYTEQRITPMPSIDGPKSFCSM
jgi:hypothetical protein